MRPILNAVRAYFADLGSSAASAWDRFFFTPADPRPLGLIRIGVGLLLFWDLAVLGVDLRDFLGSDGWIGHEAAAQFYAENVPGAWSFWFYVGDRWLYPAWAACLVVLALFTCGFATRATAVLAWVIAVSTARRVPAACFGFDHIISTWALYLAAFGASGRAFSLDRRLALRRASEPRPTPDVPPPSVAANLSLRLIQLHLALVYGSAGLAKLAGPEWWDGTAMQALALTPEFSRWDLRGLLAHPMLLEAMTHAGVALEIAYPVLVWNRKLRPLILTAVVAMHLGIDLLLGLTEFGLAMVTANLAFLPLGRPESTEAPADRTPARSRGFAETPTRC